MKAEGLLCSGRERYTRQGGEKEQKHISGAWHASETESQLNPLCNVHPTEMGCVILRLKQWTWGREGEGLK